MTDKEYQWHLKRIGKITASEVHNIMTKSGKWTKTAISYLYKVQRQRFINEPAPIKNARSLSWGKANEEVAIAWLRENYLKDKSSKFSIFHCDEDGDEKIFITGDDNFGGSPDAYLMYGSKIRAYIEIKCVYGEEETNWIFSPTVPINEKRERVYEEHVHQLAGQLLLPGSPDKIMLLKYDAPDEDNEFDMRDAIDPRRGIIFTFTKKELQPVMDEMKERVWFANKCLNDNIHLDHIQEYWERYKSENNV